MCCVVLYGCETWSVISREEHRLKVLENRVLRKIFWTKENEVRGEWRRLRDEELYGLYPPNIIREMHSRIRSIK
jgi:DNA modification methylase